ncbi:MAG: peptidase M6 [Candidatus Saccharicenans sp.]|jgi:M6 family metalloprotease-like protein|nr:peptidase M6 [Candidatus Saccharicenans sp.]MDH7574512.1 peptidase M6 [Candidatus Saccharicenans sp.]
MALWSARAKNKESLIRFTSKLKAIIIAPLFLALAFLAVASLIFPETSKSSFPPPIDPQRVQDQDKMTWADYRPIPGANWSDPALKPERGFKLAVVAVDFPDQPFVITRPKGSDPFGNPQVEPVPRDQVPQFYADFFTKPLPVNHGLNIHNYWMEISRGKFGLTRVDAYGPYRMPKPYWWYGLNEYGQNKYTPDGSEAAGRLERDCDELWIKDVGRDLRKEYDAILRIYAGYDETGVWMEFGLMKFKSKDDIPPEWGNPNPRMPRWVPTRYVEWTCWLAGSQQWGLSSMRQGENSGTIAHELGHFAFRLPDLNNNPYVQPYRRAAAGTWDLMDRGCFNGPGGPHQRWVVPPVAGAAGPPGLMIRNRMACGFISDGQLLTLSREGLAKSGLVVAEVTARAVNPLPGTYTGINVRLDGTEPGDRTPPDDPATNPLSPGIPNYNFYSLEVVQRIGFDSFCPDNGVLIAKNKDNLRGNNGGPNAFNSYIWVIDAHPEDINEVDYISPNGEKVMRTIADYRQLNDALFHAGPDSGSRFEFVDEPNRLHFYVVDLRRNQDGIISYTLAVRSLDGSGPQARGLQLRAARNRLKVKRGLIPLTFNINNTGSPAEVDPALHPSDVSRHLNQDLYRLSLTIEGKGWEAKLPNALVALPFGQQKEITVYVLPNEGCSKQAVLVLKASSESQPEKKAESRVNLNL